MNEKYVQIKHEEYFGTTVISESRSLSIQIMATIIFLYRKQHAYSHFEVSSLKDND